MRKSIIAAIILLATFLPTTLPAAAQSNADMSVQDMERALGLDQPIAPSAGGAGKLRFRAPTFSVAPTAPEPAREDAIDGDIGPASPRGSAAQGSFWLPIEFALGSAQVLPSYDAALDRIAQLMTLHPALTLIIRGHTDSTGSVRSNLVLSRQRANAVRKGLIQRGVPQDRLLSQGVGDTESLGGIGGADAKNRRVEFRRVDS